MKAWMKETSTFNRIILVGILMNFIALIFYWVLSIPRAHYGPNDWVIGGIIVIVGTFIILIGLSLSQRFIKKLELWKPITLIILVTPSVYLLGVNLHLTFIDKIIEKIMPLFISNTPYLDWYFFLFFYVILFSCPIAIFWFKFIKKSALWKEYVAATIVLAMPVGLLVISNPFLLLLPAFVATVAIASPMINISSSGWGLPPPVGSIIFFFLPFIIVSWTLKKRKVSIPKILIISYIVASIIYLSSYQAHVTQIPWLH